MLSSGIFLYTKNKSLEDIFRNAVNAQLSLQLSKAINLYNKILEHEPENTNVLSNLAKAYNSLGPKPITKNGAEKTCFDEAQEIFFKSALLENKSKKDKAEKLHDLAVFYLHLYKLELSIKFGELAYKLDRNSPRVCTTLGDAHRFREMFSDAKKWYERAFTWYSYSN